MIAEGATLTLILRLVCIAIGLFALAGCTTKSVFTTQSLIGDGERPEILVLPPNVTLRSMSGGGHLSINAEWSELAEDLIYAELEARFSESGKKARLLTETEIETIEGTGQLANVAALHRAVGESIPFAMQALPTKRNKFEFTMGTGADLLSQAFGADYALMISIDDSYASAERVAVMIAGALLGVGLPGGEQLGFASLVNLRSGQFVWFNEMRRSTGDLRNPEGAAATLDLLLTDLPQ